MTVNLETFMKFRDLQVAEDFGRMAEMGYMDKEFTVYGCAFFDKSRRGYLISIDDAKIIDFIIKGYDEKIFPTNMLYLRESCQVPLGQEENILNDVKRRLARKIKETFSEKFFNQLVMLSTVPNEDHAYELLNEYQACLIGVYDRDRLQCFENALHLAYQRKVLSHHHYWELAEWLNNVYRQMDDDIVVSDVFNKTLWGIVCEKNEKIKTYINAKKESVFLRKQELENDGWFVSPMFKKRYGYNYTYKLNNAKDDFQKDIRSYLNDEYMGLLRDICSMPNNFDKNMYSEYLKKLKNEDNLDALNTWSSYGNLWIC